MTEYDAVKDSGERQEFATGSRRDTRNGKGRFDLIPPIMLRRLAKHYENGAVKYGDCNWQRGQPLGRYLDSCFRHLVAVMENRKEEDHMAAVIWNMTAYMWTVDAIERGELPLELDDRGATETPHSRIDPELAASIASLMKPQREAQMDGSIKQPNPKEG